MKYFSANLIFPVCSPPIKNGTVVLNENNVVTEILDYQHADAVLHDGIIVPGFINAHCHLELSHLKNKITKQKGMANFISELVPKRNTCTETEIKKAVADAELEMIQNGIVAVGDIANTNHTFEQKEKQNLYYHSFIELFDLNPEKAAEIFKQGQILKSQLSTSSASFVPHAPYTVSPALFQLIDDLREKITCIHNQESRAEDDLFKHQTGTLADSFSKLGIKLDWIKNGKSSINYSLPRMMQSEKIQLIHNCYTTAEDLAFIKTQPTTTEIYFCTCPNANLYIGNKLPNYNLLISSNQKITVGTDSYASNWSLSILDELKTIHAHFPEIKFETILQWATLNGANFLGIANVYGSIEPGKKCGLNLITNIDDNALLLTQNSSVKKLA